jgi:hypothetical protein
MNKGVMWVPEEVKVMRESGFNNEGGYEEICKVCISRMMNTPTIVDFAGKKSKVATKKDKQVER